jgi:mRNA interferase HigB
MIIVSKTILNRFGTNHASAAEALDQWYDIVRKADWATPADVKATFSSVDYVGNDRFVFNIKGNSFWLVAMIFFNKRTLFVRFMGTHAEYDKIDCRII